MITDAKLHAIRYDVDPDYEVLEGEPVESILGFADSRDADLIVVSPAARPCRRDGARQRVQGDRQASGEAGHAREGASAHRCAVVHVLEATSRADRWSRRCRLEAALALKTLAEERVDIELVAPDVDFRYRPMSVAAPFGKGEARTFH